MIECIVVGTGGFIGAVCRYLVGMIPVKDGCAFPIRTLMINIAGSFIIGIIAALAMKTDFLNPRIVLFLKVGICGGFTTFSSFALETTDLMKEGRLHLAVIYTALSVILGILAVFAGQEIVGKEL
ncbi:fluoride efflux transporter CrcB [Lachnospiraceae bacterium 62-26]|mgnify:CR=1 FL=1|nr:putative fluoride ion transporter CrcB [Lachnospiraceae bacterium]